MSTLSSVKGATGNLERLIERIESARGPEFMKRV